MKNLLVALFVVSLVCGCEKTNSTNSIKSNSVKEATEALTETGCVFQPSTDPDLPSNDELDCGEITNDAQYKSVRAALKSYINISQSRLSGPDAGEVIDDSSELNGYYNLGDRVNLAKGLLTDMTSVSTLAKQVQALQEKNDALESENTELKAKLETCPKDN